MSNNEKKDVDAESERVVCGGGRGMTLTELTELRAAAARLLYSDDRKAEDYDLLIAFIERVYEKEKPPTA